MSNAWIKLFFIAFIEGCTGGLYTKKRETGISCLPFFVLCLALEAEWFNKEDDKNNNESIDTE
jgi:hypothetical protein